MRQAVPGDEVDMIVDDPKADGEIEALSREHGWPFTREDHEAGCRFVISR